jgi:hypothetical protein
MEPFCYFLGLTYGLGASVYFAVTKREASYDNLVAGSTLTRMQKKVGYDSEAHRNLQLVLQEHNRALELLRCVRLRRYEMFALVTVASHMLYPHTDPGPRLSIAERIAQQLRLYCTCFAWWPYYCVCLHLVQQRSTPQAISEILLQTPFVTFITHCEPRMRSRTMPSGAVARGR